MAENSVTSPLNQAGITTDLNAKCVASLVKTALQCWHRFNQDVNPSSSSFNNTGQGSMYAMLTTPCTALDSNWYLDSGATNHVTPDPANLVHKTSYTGPEQIYIGDGAGLQISHIGSSSFTSQFNSKILTLNHLLHVPSITKNLLSVSKFASDNNVFFEFFPNKCYVKDQATHSILVEGKLKQGLYAFDPPTFLSTSASKILPTSTPTAKSLQSSVNVSVPSSLCNKNKILMTSNESLPSCSSNSLNNFSLWHNRLGHPSTKVVKSILAHRDISCVNKCDSHFCSACCLGKITRFPFPSSQNQTTSPLQLVHTDLWGPSPTPSVNGYKYYIHFLDDYFKFTWLYLLRTKSKAFNTFCNFMAQAELQLGFKIKSVQSDWGGEYRAFTNFLISNGIHHRVSCPGSHQQNGSAERKHRHIVEMGLTLLANASMPLKYWDEAFRITVYLINRLPSTSLQGRYLLRFYLRCLHNTPPLEYLAALVIPILEIPVLINSNLDQLHAPFLGIALTTRAINV